jgi:acylphosphatase
MVPGFIRLVTARPGEQSTKIMERRRLHVFYSGQVQGVGFRYTVKSLVTGFEVTGTIRNLPDGRVELVAEGTRDELRAFQEAIRSSGLGPLIMDEQTSWSEARNEFRGFAIVG